MSTDEYSSYFEEPADNNQSENYQDQEPSQPPYEQLAQSFQALQAQMQALQANPLQSLGYQPIQPPQGRFNPEDPAVKEAREFLQAQGVLTQDALKETLANQSQEEFAVSHGWENTQHLAADFWNHYYSAKSPQAKAELDSLNNLYGSGNRANIAKAVKGFQEYKTRSQSQVTGSQTFGHVPQGQNTQNNSQVPRFKSANEFNGWMRNQDPAKQREIYANWQAGNIPDPF
jgi:hypothetical protein